MNKIYIAPVIERQEIVLEEFAANSGQIWVGLASDPDDNFRVEDWVEESFGNTDTSF